ncbi:hypothetical protein C5167_007018 [Papaver somniferum]|uniref:Bifunctional inhibitor/plant lipid transfer protein/seed storage helical domain-containing protein n=1 Tax=Papaver somniferum TaxID=3469 RepID=A0A4Y7JF57_PAPSO|nr:non-specific lipid transfer protein GPI-anchored 1-like [Papaver somniferum]RZC59713.1 hypothetical protein C5167_007018 [Papaver somniferum]
MMMRMFAALFVLCSLMMLEPALSADATPPNIQEQCTSQFGKVGACLTFATGKGPTPTPDCCSAVKDIRQHQAVCLCYIILETHKGESSLKDMGLKEDRLLALPSACKLADTSVDKCPKLLNLSPTSPDYAFFTNITSPATSTTPSGSTATSATPAAAAKDDKSVGSIHGPRLIVAVVFFAVSLFMV